MQNVNYPQRLGGEKLLEFFLRRRRAVAVALNDVAIFVDDELSGKVPEKAGQEDEEVAVSAWPHNKLHR